MTIFDNNGIPTHNRLVCKRGLDHLAKLASFTCGESNLYLKTTKFVTETFIIWIWRFK